MAEPEQLEVRDFNGEAPWSREAVVQRYRSYCIALDVAPDHPLTPNQHREGNVLYIYPIMDEVIKGIEAGDLARISLGVDFVEEDQFFRFGSILKSNAARALRRALLTEQQKARIRKRMVSMLVAGIIPHEFREYYKLLRTVGVAEYWPELRACVPQDNPFAMRFYEALCENDGRAREA